MIVVRDLRGQDAQIRDTHFAAGLEPGGSDQLGVGIDFHPRQLQALDGNLHASGRPDARFPALLDIDFRRRLFRNRRGRNRQQQSAGAGSGLRGKGALAQNQKGKRKKSNSFHIPLRRLSKLSGSRHTVAIRQWWLPIWRCCCNSCCRFNLCFDGAKERGLF